MDTIVFLPMSHVGKPSFYSSVKYNIDSLRKKKYKVIYEGVGMDTTLPRKDQVIYKKKLRKLLGFHLSQTYQDSTNQSIPKAFKNKKYVAQNKENTGLLPEIDTNIDLTKNEMIDQYEEKYGIINLDNCDLSTELDQPYECNDLSNKSFYATNIIREQYIIEEISKIKSQNLIMVYGKSHWKFLYPKLYKLGYELIEGKI